MNWFHAEILQWLWPGADRKSQIRNETHSTTGARSGCPGFSRAVIGEWSGRVFYHPSGPCQTISIQASTDLETDNWYVIWRLSKPSRPGPDLAAWSRDMIRSGFFRTCLLTPIWAMICILNFVTCTKMLSWPRSGPEMVFLVYNETIFYLLNLTQIRNDETD